MARSVVESILILEFKIIIGISQQTSEATRSFPACETRTRIPGAGHDYSKLDMSEYPLAIWNYATEERVKVFTHQTDSSLLV